MKRQFTLLLLISILSHFGYVKGQEINVFALAEGGEYSASKGGNISKLVDDNIDTDYNFTGLENEIVFKSEKAYLISRFELVSSSQSSDLDPAKFELLGSMDGKTWQSLRTLSDQTFAQRKLTKNYKIETSQAYFYFKLKIISVRLADSDAGALSEWRLWGVEKTVPQSPSSVRAKEIAENRVKLSWKENSNCEDSYEVQRSESGKDYQTIATLPANTNSYIDNDVTNNALYVYRVYSILDKTKSIYAASNPLTTSALPEMRALTTAGRKYTVKDQRNNSPVGEHPECVLDGDLATKYLTNASSAWIEVAFANPVKVEQYSISSANDDPQRDPRNWKLEASNDGNSWEVLDNRDKQSFANRFLKKQYKINNTKEYTHYRLNITANNGANKLQLSDWLLYANVPSSSDLSELETPANFKVEVRAYHHVKLSWDDVTNESAYLIERSEDGGKTFTYSYQVPANNIEDYPYSLKPETNYVYKIYAVNAELKSQPATLSFTTPKREFRDKWENYKLWIIDQPATFTKVEEIGNTAFYMIDGYKKSDVDQLYYDFYAANWDYVFECYGEELSDSRLHVLLIPQEGGGGLASIYDYRSASAEYSNMVYIKANKSWFKNRAESGYIYDVMAHEICHIIEGVGGGYNGSMFYPIWGDSKWAEILQYDIFSALGSPRAQSWHNSYGVGENAAGGASYPTEGRVSYWYRDFFYPTYEAYGKTDVLKKFWKLQKEHYRRKNGNFVSVSTNPGGRGNLGELIHFWSGACGVDVKKYAIKAFGWNDQYEMWLEKAKIDYPDVVYADAPIDNSVKNICQNGGTLNSNISGLNLANFIDNKYSTFYLIRKGNEEYLNLTYNSPIAAKLNTYTLTFKDATVPAAWILYGSMDGNNWDVIDTQDKPTFTNDNITLNIQTNQAYKQYKFEFSFKESGQIRLSEIELFGIEYLSAPSNLTAKGLSDKAVYIDWDCLLDEIEYFELERSSDGVTFSKIADIDKDEISYTDNSILVPGKYYYRIAIVNKNQAKDKVYSNIAFVNTQANSLDNINDTSISFEQLINQLNIYPNNEVTVYSVSGHRLLNMTGQGSNLQQVLNSNLPKGVYIVQVKINNDAIPVCGKIIVR